MQTTRRERKLAREELERPSQNGAYYNMCRGEKGFVILYYSDDETAAVKLGEFPHAHVALNVLRSIVQNETQAGVIIL